MRNLTHAMAAWRRGKHRNYLCFKCLILLSRKSEAGLKVLISIHTKEELGTMRLEFIAALSLAVWLGPSLNADTVTLTSGGRIEGVIKKMEKGKVRIDVAGGSTAQDGNSVREVDLRDIVSVDFDTPHLTEGTSKLPLDHFLKNLDAQEMVRLSRDINVAREQSRRQLDQINATWAVRQPVEKDQARRWAAAKESFSAPFGRYRELVQDMYLHVLAQVDDYNSLAQDAQKIYVGVKGIFNVGSPLVPTNLDQLTIKQAVPKNWYDKIFYEGYNRGYREGADFERLSRVPAPAASDNTR